MQLFLTVQGYTANYDAVDWTNGENAMHVHIYNVMGLEICSL